jgi:hypothetical protein
VLQRHDPIHLKYMVDLHMHVLFGDALERYEYQWENILQASGFIFQRYQMIRALCTLIFAKPN